jgi:Asp-tRNA(Asn)/Glu-tRNA(Gln) amidotransferase A subunit family amidase
MFTINLDECLARIGQMDGRIRAWAVVSPQSATGLGPLDGVPFGVKDIFDTAGIATEWGSPVMKGRVPSEDSALVRGLRGRGAIMVGKTHTTSFAYFDPAPTVNPHSSEHTPGGSSSGSAAAVAAGMVPFALGSQTQGSVLRPASFCGCTGFKPTFGTLPLEGTMAFAPTLDTAGLFTQTAADMVTLWSAMGFDTSSKEAGRLIALPLPDEVEPAMRERFLTAASRLGADTVTPPFDVWGLWRAVSLVQEVQGARTHEAAWRKHGVAMGAKLAALIEKGLSTAEADYAAALGQIEAGKQAAASFFADHPVWIAPAALGPAPRTLASTGNPRMNAPFTGLGAPAISIPMPVGGGDLPLGLQIVAASGRDALLLATAAAVENMEL